MTFTEIADFIQEIFDLEGVEGWIVQSSAPSSECIIELKTIMISETVLDQPDCYQKELAIHEIAHALTQTSHHDVTFYRILGGLFLDHANEIGANDG